MKYTLAELADLVGGQIVGDPQTEITGVAPLYEAAPGQITFYDVSGDSKQRQLLKSVTAVLVPTGVSVGDVPTIEVDQLHESFAKIIGLFRPKQQSKRIGVSPQAVVCESATLGVDVDIHPLATIGPDVEIGDGSTIYSGVQIMAGTKIGRNVTIFPNAVVYEDSVIGDESVLHASCVIGAYGFGYDQIEGRHELSAQLGNVVLGDRVEVGASTTIDRGTYGSTSIGEGTKIDNQVMVAHNCRIGRHNLLCSQVGIAGSTSTGDYVVMAGQVGVKDHVHIGDRSILGAMAGVIGDVQSDAHMVGIPATPVREQMNKQVFLARLPEMRAQLKKLIAVVEKLTGEKIVKGRSKKRAA
jgi:UDP-3-O-[3-hydroxymyristoyl] glucosamine N-acyltransferase